MLALALLLAAGPPLKAPAPLTAKATGPYSALIAWKPPVDALGVEVEVRRAGKVRWQRLLLQSARPPEFAAHALPPGAALELRARSWNGRAPSDWTRPLPLRTQGYAEPRLALDGPCVAREQLLATALGAPRAPSGCDAQQLQTSALGAGALALLLVDPVRDAPGCRDDAGQVTEAFAEVGGCLRFAGELIRESQPLPVAGVALPPLRSFWRASAESGFASTVELRDGRLRVVDSGPVDSAFAFADLPRTTDLELVEQLQGAAGAALLRQ